VTGPEPSRSRPGPGPWLWLPLAAALAAALGILAARSTSREETTADPFAFVPPVSRPAGEPFRVRGGPREAGTFRGEGSFRFEQRLEGSSGPAPAPPARRVEGTFTSERVVEAVPSGVPRTRVTAVLRARTREGDAWGAETESRLVLSFEPGSSDAMARAGAKTEVDPALRDAVEPLVHLWAGPLPLPARDVRVGEAFPAKEEGPTDPAREVVDVEAIRRRVFLLFPFDSRGIAVVQGGTWVESRSGVAPDEEAVVRTAVRIAQSGPTSVPGQPPVDRDYEYVLRARHRLRLADAAPLVAEVVGARRLRAKEGASDATVRTDLEARVTETRAR
jgi:hypothetical protein